MMTLHSGEIPSLSLDVLRLVFEQLEDDATSLFNVSLTCQAWRSLSLSSLYRNVDLSYHNIGDGTTTAVDGGNEGDEKATHLFSNAKMVYTNFLDRFRPDNLVHRQRAFLRAITAHPKLATYVKSLKWTLVWKDYEDTCLTEVDRQTWNVFGQMKNVTKLDLASLHDIHDDDFVRQSPSRLFPAVVDLRLAGWMHRGLAKAIFSSMNTARLRSLALDYVQDEGALPDGSPMSLDFAKAYNAGWYGGRNASDDPTVISQTLLDLQESGKAFIFPGPMWLPLHLLSTARLDSLSHLRVEVPPLSGCVHLQNYNTFFQRTADLIGAASASLQSLVIILGDAQGFPDSGGKGWCGTTRLRLRHAYGQWHLEAASLYLFQLVTALNKATFPQLHHVRFEGFDVLEHVSPTSPQAADIGRTFEAIRKCPFAATASFTELPSGNERPTFNGYINGIPLVHPDDWEQEFQDMLDASMQ
jgi:hypothetical protein